jgi:hypothetical protein
MEKHPGSLRNPVSNLVRILDTSQLHVSTRISGPPDSVPASKVMEKYSGSLRNPVSNLVRILDTSQLHVSTRIQSFPQEKRAILDRILLRSASEPGRKLSGFPLGFLRVNGNEFAQSFFQRLSA